MRESAPSCPIQNTISILSTLDPARSSRLGKIVLEVTRAGSWFSVDGRAVYGEDWEGLDTVLSKLGKVSISKGEKRLTFILVITRRGYDENLMPMVRKWLPKHLPRFNELGVLHVHCGRGRRYQAVGDSYLTYDKPDEGF
jgi:hypothetical protein